MTPTEFLLARIAEDETVARAIEADLRREFGHDVDLLHSPLSIEDFGDMGYPAIVVDLTRVLAECEAKRRIVEDYLDAEQAVAGYDNHQPDQQPSYWQEWGNRHALRLAVELHAAIYADHPDYDEAWRP